MQRPLTPLQIDPADVADVKQRVDHWIQEALATNCTTLFLSSEDFSTLNCEHWASLTGIFRQNGAVSSIGIVHVMREVQAMVRSAYGTLVMLGENRYLEDVAPALERRFTQASKAINDLSDEHRLIDKRIELNYDDLSGKNVFVERFCSLGLQVEIPTQEWPTLNEALPHDVVEATRVWNLAHCPGVTIDDGTGDFPDSYFALDPAHFQDRARFVSTMLVRRTKST